MNVWEVGWSGIYWYAGEYYYPMTLCAELVTPFFMLGYMITHIAQFETAGDPIGVFCHLSLEGFADVMFNSGDVWPQRFPYGYAVLPDNPP